MKNKLKLLAVALCVGLFTIITQAQNATNVLPAFVPITDQLTALGKDAFAQLKGLDLKGGLTVSAFGLYHNRDLGGGLAIRTVATNGLQLGVAIAAIDEHHGKTHAFSFYDASLSLGYNKPVKVPVLGLTLDTFVESGPAFDANDPKRIYVQSVAGVRKSWNLNDSTHLTISGGIGHLTKWGSSPFELFVVSLTKKL